MWPSGTLKLTFNIFLNKLDAVVLSRQNKIDIFHIYKPGLLLLSCGCSCSYCNLIAVQAGLRPISENDFRDKLVLQIINKYRR